MNQNNQVSRVPVIDPDGKPLMPTTPARARKWIQLGKAVGKRNKVGVFYVQLTEKPSGYETQTISVGTDRGKCFTGIAFQTKMATIARHLFGGIFPRKMPHCFTPAYQDSTSLKRRLKTVSLSLEKWLND